MVKKESATAIVLGIITGVVIAVGVVYFVSDSNSRKPSEVIEPELTPNILKRAEDITPFSIESPTPDTITNKNTIDIKGSVQKDTLIIIQSPVTEKIELAKDEKYTITMPLMQGENSFRISTYYDTDIDSRELIIYYIEEK